jgi:hypothetical protein
VDVDRLRKFDVPRLARLVLAAAQEPFFREKNDVPWTSDMEASEL